MSYISGYMPSYLSLGTQRTPQLPYIEDYQHVFDRAVGRASILSLVGLSQEQKQRVILDNHFELLSRQDPRCIRESVFAHQMSPPRTSINRGPFPYPQATPSQRSHDLNRTVDSLDLEDLNVTRRLGTASTLNCYPMQSTLHSFLSASSSSLGLSATRSSSGIGTTRLAGSIPSPIKTDSASQSTDLVTSITRTVSSLFSDSSIPTPEGPKVFVNPNPDRRLPPFLQAAPPRGTYGLDQTMPPPGFEELDVTRRLGTASTLDCYPMQSTLHSFLSASSSSLGLSATGSSSGLGTTRLARNTPSPIKTDSASGSTDLDTSIARTFSSLFSGSYTPTNPFEPGYYSPRTPSWCDPSPRFL